MITRDERCEDSIKQRELTEQVNDINIYDFGVANFIVDGSLSICYSQLCVYFKDIIVLIMVRITFKSALM